MSNSLLEGEDPPKKIENKPYIKEHHHIDGKSEGESTESYVRKPGLTRQRTLIELDQNSVEKLLNFAGGDSDESDEEINDSPKKSPFKNSSLDEFDSTSYSLDTVEMHSRLQEELNSTWSPSTCRANLSLEELSHVRFVAAKASVDSLQEEGLKRSVAAGKTCYQCKKTKFNIFRRARACQVCRHALCHSCQQKISTSAKLSSASTMPRESTPVSAVRKGKVDMSKTDSPSCQGSLLVCHECSQTILEVSREEETAARMMRARSALFSSFRRKNSTSELSKSYN